MIIHDKRLIYVHIQKTGGTAINLALGQTPSQAEKHFLAIELRERYGRETWESYYKFAIVRNPWDRLVSWWSMIDAHREDFNAGQFVNNFYRFVLERAKSFEEFLDKCDGEVIDSDGRKWIYRNQLDYISDTSGNRIIGFVGRFETLQQDFDFVAKKVLGRVVTLPHVNTSNRHHYSTYYDAALAQKVARRFRRDIEFFGYEFEK